MRARYVIKLVPDCLALNLGIFIHSECRTYGPYKAKLRMYNEKGENTVRVPVLIDISIKPLAAGKCSLCCPTKFPCKPDTRCLTLSGNNISGGMRVAYRCNLSLLNGDPVPGFEDENIFKIYKLVFCLYDRQFARRKYLFVNSSSI